MVNPKEPVELEALIKSLNAVGVDWNELAASAEQIILFGSRATGLDGRSSDWDLLCVGAEHSKRYKKIDLIWVTPAWLESEAWLGSELAGHIARYGQWLKGEDTWSKKVHISQNALELKLERINSLVTAAEEEWEAFSIPYRKKYVTRIRLDLQRYEMLSSGENIPPKVLLEQAWKKTDREHEFLRLVDKAGILSPFVENDLAAWAAQTYRYRLD